MYPIPRSDQIVSLFLIPSPLHPPFLHLRFIRPRSHQRDLVFSAALFLFSHRQIAEADRLPLVSKPPPFVAVPPSVIAEPPPTMLKAKKMKIEHPRKVTKIRKCSKINDSVSTPSENVAIQENENSGTKKKKSSVENSLMCHQCQRNDKGRVVQCQNCNRKRFCVPCMTRWYPHLSEAEFAKACPFCRNNCNCKACLRMQGIGMPPKKKLKPGDMERHACHLLHFLLPWLKEECQDNLSEKQLEAKIIGLELTEFELQKAECEKDERSYCNRCQTSLFDFHRSCPSCLYDLCLACCRELREGHIPGGGGTLLTKTYEHRGQDYLHGGSPNCKRKTVVSRKNDNIFGDLRYWKANQDGSISCPPERIGGCGSSLLELKCLYPEKSLSMLEKQATAFIGSNSAISLGASTCYSSSTASGQLDFPENMLRRAAFRDDSDDNYLYCPTARDVQEEELEHFQIQWAKGEPVIVRNVLELTSGLSWEPMVMWRALREKKESKAESEHLAVKVIDCLDLCETLV